MPAPEAEAEPEPAIWKEKEEEEIAAPEEVAPVAPEAEEAPPVEAPMPAPEEGAPAEDLARFIASRRAYAEEHPDDHEARLELGRVLWQADERQEAVEVYETLIGRSKLLDDAIADLEDYKEQGVDAQVMQALGDAYVKADRLQDALDIYRQALASL
jgi:tetratricopeptide (TPR) repeat protein